MPHIHDLIDFSAEVFIVYRNKVLLRKHDKYRAWLSVGGHIELNEDPNQAAIREVKEEVGLDIKLDDRMKPSYEGDSTVDLIPPFYLNRNRINANHEHVTFVYFATVRKDKIVQVIEEELSEECRWFTKEEIQQNDEILPNIKFYAQKALKLLSDKKIALR